jgi:hypothetical protein
MAVTPFTTTLFLLGPWCRLILPLLILQLKDSIVRRCFLCGSHTVRTLAKTSIEDTWTETIQGLNSQLLSHGPVQNINAFLPALESLRSRRIPQLLQANGRDQRSFIKEQCLFFQL